MNIYLLKFATTFTLLQRTIVRKKIWNKVWFNIVPKMGKICFAKDEGNIQLFCFSSVFAFKQAKEHILIQVQPQNYK